VSVLSAIDQKIELNRKINARLSKLANSLYDFWFVQYEFPYNEGGSYKDLGGKLIFNESASRLIPFDWNWQKVGEFEDAIVTGKTPPTNEPANFDGDIPFIKIADIRNNTHIVATEETLSDKGANLQPKKFIDSGDICVTCIATPGLVGIATERSQTNQQINTIKVKNHIYRYYLFFALRDHFKIQKAKTGNIFANMNKEDFCNIEILVPDSRTVEAYSSKVEPIFAKILVLEKEIIGLQKLRDWLLPMLMSGQVTVQD
jgi:type I restriction enzyme S subunit